MDDHYLDSAKKVRASIERGERDPSWFRAQLMSVPPLERDTWIDAVFGIDVIPEDGPELPSGCVPYLPCAVDALLRVAEHARIGPTDIFVDIGSGLGRAVALIHLLTGASALGIEVQPGHVARARELAARLRFASVSFVEGDAAHLVHEFAAGSVFLLYCPFSGQRLIKQLASFENIARTRTIRVCCVDLPLPPCRWLEPMQPTFPDLTIYRSIYCE